MEITKGKQWLIAFIKTILLMGVIFFIGLSVSQNDVTQGFIDYFWLLILAALLISGFRVFFRSES